MAEIENTYGSIVTDVGVQLITQAVMEGQKVNIVKLAVGDGGGRNGPHIGYLPEWIIV